MENVIIEYKGDITFDKIEELLTLFNHNILSTISPLCKTRLFSIMVECLENAYRHNYKLPDQHPAIELLLTEHDNSYTLKISNLIDADKLPQMTNRLEQINKLDSVSVKKVYNEAIHQAHISEKGGAGLGLLKIMRSSNQPIKYESVSVDERCSLLTLTIRIIDCQHNKKKTQ
ncbi:MAG: SiaB family protein kinase [Salinivirgaceae bacterium]|nr:SiaB family protein kinase [Salinivirgaceae bacterium]